jgi:hypothetical protein
MVQLSQYARALRFRQFAAGDAFVVSPPDVRSGRVKAATIEHGSADRRDAENALSVEI